MAATGNSATATIPTAGVTYFAGTFVRYPLALAAKASLRHPKEAEGRRTGSTLNVALTGDGRRTERLLAARVGAPIPEVRHFASLAIVTSSWKTIRCTQDLLFRHDAQPRRTSLDNFPFHDHGAHGVTSR